MNKYIYKVMVLLAVVLVSCDDANELLDQYIEDGPIVYAGKIDDMETQSGFYRYRVNLFPAADVNRSHCILSWAVNNGLKDSVIVQYVPANYDEEKDCYYTIIELPDVEGNLSVEAQNVDVFGNTSLTSNEGAFIYGETYVSTLLNSGVSFSDETDEIIFENRVGSVGNYVSYEKNDGQFTEEVLVRTDRFPLIDAKSGGIVRNKTRYLMAETDIDTLVTTEFLETIIP